MGAQYGSRYMFVAQDAEGRSLAYPQPYFTLKEEGALCTVGSTLVWYLNVAGVMLNLGCACHHPDPNVLLASVLGIAQATAQENMQ